MGSRKITKGLSVEEAVALPSICKPADLPDHTTSTRLLLTLCRNSLHSSLPSGACALKLAASSGSVAGSHSSKSMPLRIPWNLELT